MEPKTVPAPPERGKGLGGGRHRAGFTPRCVPAPSEPSCPSRCWGKQETTRALQRKGHPNKRDKNGEIPEDRSVLGAEERDE